MKNVVVLGDKTSHGGMVTSASSTFDIEGKNVALLHDRVSCEKHGSNRIIECEPDYEEQGKGIVTHLCKTECGSVVYASLTDAGFD